MVTFTWLGLFYGIILSYFIIKGLIYVFSYIVGSSYIVNIEDNYNNRTYTVRAFSENDAYIKGVARYCELHSAEDIKKVEVTKSDS